MSGESKFKKGKKYLQDEVEKLVPEETGLLIKWNRQEGTFTCDFVGPPLQGASVSVLLDAVKKHLQKSIQPSGYLKTFDPVEKQEEEEEEDLPDWMKNN